MKKKSLLLLFLIIPICISLAHAEGYSFKLDEPSVSITIPAMPEMKMEPHPYHDQYSHLRYKGDTAPYVLTIMTPTADAGMTPMECAQSLITSYKSRYNLKDSEYAVYKLNETTFLLEYLTNMQGLDQVHAHLMSSSGGTHCIDVHISRRGHTDSEIQDLHEKFEGAQIQTQ